MLYNSFTFLLFFPVVILLYWLCPNRMRKGLLLVVSYLFYMNWEPVYGLLLAGVTIVTYGGERLIEQDKERRRFWLVGCLLLTFFPLVIYKYLNFICDSVWGILDMAGLRMAVPHFELLLPIGISFYSFQAAGYLIDVYQGRQLADP